MRCYRLSTVASPRGGRPSSPGPARLPGVFSSSPGHPSPALQNPPNNSRCRQTLFPPATARNAQRSEVIGKTGIKELQSGRNARRIQRTPLCSPPWMVSTNIISNRSACHHPEKLLCRQRLSHPRWPRGAGFLRPQDVPSQPSSTAATFYCSVKGQLSQESEEILLSAK